MIEKFKTTIPLSFTVNSILIYDIWNANKVGRLNALNDKKYLIPFFLQKRLARIYFSKEYLFARKKRLPGVFIHWEILTGE